MKVLTLSQTELVKCSESLAEDVLHADIKMDAIIGIATGGVYVSRPFRDFFVARGVKMHYYELKLSRPSTHTKQKLGVKRWLRTLPSPLLNLLRIVEVKLFEQFKPKYYQPSKEEHIHLEAPLVETIKNIKNILLIDDAVDTGSTLLALTHVIQNINPNIQVHTAVLTVTHKHPYIEPDFTLYKHVLLRCPWANDYKGEDKIA